MTDKANEFGQEVESEGPKERNNSLDGRSFDETYSLMNRRTQAPQDFNRLINSEKNGSLQIPPLWSAQFPSLSSGELQVARKEEVVNNEPHVSMQNIQLAALPALAKRCLDSLSAGQGIPDSFEQGLYAAVKEYGTAGEDLFIRFINKELSERNSNFRVRPGAIPQEHANNPAYRSYTLTDTRNGNFADIAEFAIGRFDAPAPNHNAEVRPNAVSLDNVHQTKIPDLAARSLDIMQNGDGIPDSFEAGLNEAISKYGVAGENAYIQFINQKLATANSNFRIRPGAIPAEHSNNPTYRVYTLTNVQTGAFADTACFPLGR
jgi:hypothetical protein